MRRWPGFSPWKTAGAGRAWRARHRRRGARPSTLPARIALVADGGPAAGALARIVARRSAAYEGIVAIGARNLADLPRAVVGRRIAYAGVEPTCFRARFGTTSSTAFAETSPNRWMRKAARRCGGSPRRSAPATRSKVSRVPGSTTTARRPDRTISTAILLDLLKRIGLEDDVYRFGLSGMVHPERQPDLAGT